MSDAPPPHTNILHGAQLYRTFPLNDIAVTTEEHRTWAKENGMQDYRISPLSVAMSVHSSGGNFPCLLRNLSPHHGKPDACWPRWFSRVGLHLSLTCSVLCQITACRRRGFHLGSRPVSLVVTKQIGQLGRKNTTDSKEEPEHSSQGHRAKSKPFHRFLYDPGHGSCLRDLNFGLQHRSLISLFATAASSRSAVGARVKSRGSFFCRKAEVASISKVHLESPHAEQATGGEMQR